MSTILIQNNSNKTWFLFVHKQIWTSVVWLRNLQHSLKKTWWDCGQSLKLGTQTCSQMTKADYQESFFSQWRSIRALAHLSIQDGISIQKNLFSTYYRHEMEINNPCSIKKKVVWWGGQTLSRDKLHSYRCNCISCSRFRFKYHNY